MASYAIGDIQGCYSALQCLLEKIDFNPKHDKIWVAGDLVNRGPQSLECLRLLKSLGDAAICVLGNHDLHLLAIAHGVRTVKSKDTLNDVLTAPDKIELLDWLQQQPLIHHDKEQKALLVHAGIPHIWSTKQAKKLAREVESILQGSHAGQYFDAMYGDTPHSWSSSLTPPDRLRVITNYLTRMRFCTPSGQLDLKSKGDPEQCPAQFSPWFKLRDPHPKVHIYFGHWAALNGHCEHPDITALDTGCSWGNKLTAVNILTKEQFHCNC